MRRTPPLAAHHPITNRDSPGGPASAALPRAKKPKEAGMKMPRISFKSRLAAAAAVATLAGGLTLAAAGPASAYGNGPGYQVELSAHISGPSDGRRCARVRR